MPGYLVACKSVIDPASEGAKDLLQEAVVMANVDHPNLVSLIGVITSGVPLLLVVAFCEHGSLLSVLRTNAEQGTPLTLTDKLKVACDVARGMVHLSQNRFVHRDLACRNVLLATGMVTKVADFGLSRRTAARLPRPDDDASGGGDNAGEVEPPEYYKSTSDVMPVYVTPLSLSLSLSLSVCR